MAARLSLERPNERRLRPPLFLTPLSAAPRRRPGSRGKPPPAAIQMRPILATCQPSGTPFRAGRGSDTPMVKDAPAAFLESGRGQAGGRKPGSIGMSPDGGWCGLFLE